MAAKTESLKSAKNMEALYLDAITAMRSYSGNINPSNEGDDEDEDNE